MATLKSEHKVFIVGRLAAFDTPHQCADAVNDEFGIIVSPQQVQTYHPEKHAGRNLSPTFKNLFYELRAKFRAQTEDIPIANRAYRVAVLNRMAANAERQKNMALAAQLIEQAAKEMGEAYTNRQRVEHTSPDGTMTPAPGTVVNADLSGLSTEDLQALASIADKLSGSN